MLMSFQTDFFLFCVFSVAVAFIISFFPITICIDMIICRFFSKEFWKAYNRYDSKAVDLWNKINALIIVGSTLFLSLIFTDSNISDRRKQMPLLLLRSLTM